MRSALSTSTPATAPLVALTVLALLAVLAAGPAPARAEEPPLAVKKVNVGVELADPVGDVHTLHSSNEKDYPGYDVVKLVLASDGKTLSFAATLHDNPGVFASEVLEIFFDTDHDAKTGVKMVFPEIGGFEYTADLDACVEFSDKSSACVGGGGKAKAVAHYAAIDLERYTGASPYDKEGVVSVIGFPGQKASAKTSIGADRVVRGAIDYADLKVKPGQTVRILVREGCSGMDLSGYFPEILLTLK